MVCAYVDVDVNMVADCRLGGLITPLFDRSPTKAIEVFTAITLIRVERGGAVEADGPVARLVVTLDDSPFWVERRGAVEADGPVARLVVTLDDSPFWVERGGAVEADGPVARLVITLDDSPFWVDEGVIAGVTLCISVVEVCATATGWLAI